MNWAKTVYVNREIAQQAKSETVAMSCLGAYWSMTVATDGAKTGGTKDRMETQRLSETTYGVWQGPESAEILRNKRREATALQERLGVRLNQTDKTRAVEQGVLSGRLGDAATAAEAELFAISAILRKVQAQQTLGHYGKAKARVLIMLDCLAGLRMIERVWRERKNTHRRLQNGAVLEAITNVRENLGVVCRNASVASLLGARSSGHGDGPAAMAAAVAIARVAS
eukprot:6212525-Pleurochrysis_carterae.AAC.1